MSFKQGDRIFGPHGPGVIAEVRSGKDNEYLKTCRDSTAIMACAILGSVDVFYGPERYPYSVQFDCGYRDVYSGDSLEEFKGQCYSGCSDNCPPTYERRFKELLANDKS